MKRQYLGDSKDSFKWDYLHALVDALGYDRLRIAWLWTPDDHGPDGRTDPERFPARPEILDLCQRLRAKRDPGLVADLPLLTRARYTVAIHESQTLFTPGTRAAYLANLRPEPREVLFFDPDNGFEPEKTCTDKHLAYVELDQILRRAPKDFVAVIFQHHRRKKFSADFARIRQRLLSGHATAIHWHTLMFVCVATNPATLARIRAAHTAYARTRPVTLLP